MKGFVCFRLQKKQKNEKKASAPVFFYDMHLQPANLRIIIGLHAHLLFTNYGAQTSQKNSPVEEVEDTYC